LLEPLISSLHWELLLASRIEKLLPASNIIIFYRALLHEELWKNSIAISGYASLGIRCLLLCCIFLFKVIALLVVRYKKSELHTFPSFQPSGALLGYIWVCLILFIFLFIDSNC
jgi:hypothetical protein